MSSSLTVHGSLKPIYLLNGILGAKFPKNIINIEHKPTIKISLILGSSELLIGDNIENIQQIMIIRIVSLFKVLIVLIFTFPSDSFAILGAFTSNIIKVKITTAPIIEIVKLLSLTMNPPINIISDVIKNNIFIKLNFFIKFPPFYFDNRLKKFPRTSWITDVLIE